MPSSPGGGTYGDSSIIVDKNSAISGLGAGGDSVDEGTVTSMITPCVVFNICSDRIAKSAKHGYRFLYVKLRQIYGFFDQHRFHTLVMRYATKKSGNESNHQVKIL